MYNRRTHPIVLKVMDTIGDDPQIYMMFMQMIRIVFEATPHPSLCSLRVDILMNFHDLDCEPVSFVFLIIQHFYLTMAIDS
jgi:hypothetical protein